MNSPIPSLQSNILVVDDTPANLQLLTGMLKEKGYKVRPAPNGELALRAAQTSPPDLILLDITMPGMDGYEVCSHLKADERLREIPVLFISALGETIDKVRAFQAGGVDYITKPFQLEEVDARVKTHLELRRQKRELEEALARQRELERLRDSLIHMIAHDMRSPLLAIQLTLDFLAPLVPESDPELAGLVVGARSNTAIICEMIKQMLDVSRMEAGVMTLELASSDIVRTVGHAVDAQRVLAGKRSVVFTAETPIFADFDADLVRRVVSNLIGNAIKFTAPERGEIRVSVASLDSFIRIEVSDNGQGIAPEYHTKIFEKFGQVGGSSARVGTGLGLTFARMAIEAHGGKIGVKSALGEGSCFWFSLPMKG